MTADDPTILLRTHRLASGLLLLTPSGTRWDWRHIDAQGQPVAEGSEATEDEAVRAGRGRMVPSSNREEA